MEFFSFVALTSSEKWSTGGITTLIGLGMTFVMLALLIGAIQLLRLILKELDKILPRIKEKTAKLIKNPKSKVVSVVAPEEISSVQKTAIDDETLSVIEQSVKQYVAASATDGKPHDKIKIISVKEVSDD